MIQGKIVAANFYVDGRDWLGKGEIKIPPIEHDMEEIKNMAISGGIELPKVGRLKPIKGEVKLTAVDKDAYAVALNPRQAVMIEARGVIQRYNEQTGMIEDVPAIVKMRAFFSKVETGSWKAEEGDEPTLEYSAVYMKLVIDGEGVFEYDPVAYKYVVNGVDLLAERRRALGR